MRIFAVALAVSSIPAQAADQFDLICSGTKEWHGTRPIELTKLPVTFRLRIDTEARKFCYDQCEGLYSINLVAPKALFFGGFNEAEADRRTEMVDRVTGEYLFIKSWVDDALSLEIHAQCSVTNFSGFPDPPAKF